MQVQLRLDRLASTGRRRRCPQPGVGPRRAMRAAGAAVRLASHNFAVALPCTSVRRGRTFVAELEPILVHGIITARKRGKFECWSIFSAIKAARKPLPTRPM